MQKLSEEKDELLSDLEDLVDSYRELERERDNYESILKMILKEKNSAESNIHGLLDSLLVHLSNFSQNQKDSEHGEYSSACLSDISHQHHHSANSRSFLENALHVIQEQNIAIREEMAKLKENLQTTTGQNTLLQANNTSLMNKVNDLQRQMENKEGESAQLDKHHRDKFDQLDKLYNTILSAKVNSILLMLIEFKLRVSWIKRLIVKWVTF